MKKGLITKTLAVLLLVVCIFSLTGCKKSREEVLTSNMKELAKAFYEKQYYPEQKAAQSDLKGYLESFSKTGVVIDLENISAIDAADQKLVKDMINVKTKKACDKNKTYVIIYPQKPYGKTDYKIEVNLDCGLKK